MKQNSLDNQSLINLSTQTKPSYLNRFGGFHRENIYRQHILTTKG